MAVEANEEFPTFERVLMISAHPDDPDFGAAGTLARLAQAGSEVKIVICTDGSEGGEDPAIPDHVLTAQRYEEQRAAAKELGIAEVIFLGHPDGRLQHTLDFRREITRLIRVHRPELVLTHVPVIDINSSPGAYHPDHLAVGAATLAAVYPASRNPRAFRELLAEGLEAWRVKEVWIPTWAAGDYYVDITSTVETKISALRRHDSQVKNWEKWDETLRQRMREIGEKSGHEYAEGFKRIKI
ncbi:MAG: PIG-L family deacetylase [Candidatus Dormibacteraeota bacterium]|nr:PIG-L family deacetylase [Candidatus Dormibacteraeota bacterium]